MVKPLPTMQETRVPSLGRADLLEKEMAIHCNTLAWQVPEMEESGGLESMGLQRVGHDWATSLFVFMAIQWPEIQFFSSTTVVHMCMLSCVWLFVTPAHQAPLSMGFSGKNTGLGCHFLLQRIFLTQGWNPRLLHCRQIFYSLSYQISFNFSRVITIFMNRSWLILWFLHPKAVTKWILLICSISS